MHAVQVDSNYLNIDTGCVDSSYVSFTAMSRVNEGDYDLYTKLTTRGQTANVEAYTKVSDDRPETKCQKVGSVEANSDSWVKVGTVSIGSGLSDTIFQLSSKDFSGSLSANRPMLMAVSKGDSTCVPIKECYVKIAGAIGYILPPGTLSDQSSLRFFKVVNPNTDTLLGVTYYVDGKAVNSSKRLQSFDLRYVTHNEQSLMSVLDYASGQRIVIEQSPPSSYSDNFFNYIFRLYGTSPGLFSLIIGILALALAATSVLLGVRAYNKRMAWRRAHGFEEDIVADVSYSEEQYERGERHIKILNRAKIASLISFGIIVIVVLILIVNNFMLIMYKVDGKSMTNTFTDGSWQFVNRIPVTVAHMSSREYTPTRGEVVVVHKVYGIVDSELEVQSGDSFIIKRVLGLPGEKVVIKDGVITIYNKEFLSYNSV